MFPVSILDSHEKSMKEKKANRVLKFRREFQLNQKVQHRVGVEQ